MANVKGAALISVLFITAIIALIASAVALQLRYLIDYNVWAMRSDQLLLALQGVKYWGVTELLRSPMKQGKIMLPPQATRFPKTHYYNMTVSGYIKDQQALFNLNDLMHKSQEMRFVRLLQAINPQISTQQAFTYAMSIHDKIIQQTGGISAHLFDATQLLTIPALPVSVYRQLKPYVVALNETTSTSPININTTSVPVLMSLSKSLSLAQARVIVRCVKRSGPFTTIERFNNVCLAPSRLPSLPNITTSSQYFMIYGQATAGIQQRRIRVAVQSEIDNGKWKITTLWQAID